MERRQEPGHRQTRSESCRKLGSNQCNTAATGCGDHGRRQDLGPSNPDQRCGCGWRIRVYRSAIEESHATLGILFPCYPHPISSKISAQTSGVTVTLMRDLHLSQSFLAGSPLPNASDISTQVEFRGPEYSVPPGVEGIASLVVDIPRHSRGVKGGFRSDDNGKATEGFFEVRCTLRIKIDMAPGRCVLRFSVLHLTNCRQ